jgi:colanic acid biosynthesis glycosyl transferase WcaI
MCGARCGLIRRCRPERHGSALMRLLIVSQYFWPETFRINEVARDLVSRGHHVTVLCGTPNYPAGRLFEGYGWLRRTREVWCGVQIVRVPVVPRGQGSRWRLAANYLSYAIMASLLGPIRCRGRADVVLVFQMSPVIQGIAAVVMKRLRRAPMLFWVQDLWPESLIAVGAIRTRWLLWPIEMLVRGLYRASALVLIQSRAFSSHVAAHGVPPDRIRYFPNLAESSYVPLPLEAAHPALNQVPRGFRVMFAGNIGTAQDLPTVLAAAELTRERPEIQWVIVGDGSMRAWVQAEIERRRLAAVHLLGRFPVEDMPRLFAGADALLVTLRRDPVLSLTIPAKVQSYLACAKPIIGALDGEGAAIIVEAGAGVCAPAEDPVALAAGVRELCDLNAAARLEMGRRGRDYFQANFGSDMLLGRLENWCSELASTRGTASRDAAI